MGENGLDWGFAKIKTVQQHLCPTPNTFSPVSEQIPSFPLYSVIPSNLKIKNLDKLSFVENISSAIKVLFLNISVSWLNFKCQTNKLHLFCLPLFTSYLFPKVLFPTPVGPNRIILGWGRVSVVQPHLISSSNSSGSDAFENFMFFLLYIYLLL